MADSDDDRSAISMMMLGEAAAAYLVRDTFTDAAETSLTSHTPDVPGSGNYVAAAWGGFQIAAGGVSAMSAVSNHTASTFNVAAAPVDVVVDITWANPLLGDGGLSLCHDGVNGFYYYAFRTADNGTVLRIIRQRDAVVIAAVSETRTPGATETWKGTRNSSGQLTLYIGGVQKLQVTDTTESGTFHGLDGYNPPSVRWDNLFIYNFGGAP